MTAPPLLILALALGAFAAPALADPCKAIPDKGPMPSYLYRGAQFTGPVVYIGDGDSLCVEVARGPTGWVEVRLADFYAPEIREPAGPAAKAALERMAWHKPVTCTVDHQSYDRVVARCTDARGVSLGDLMRRAGITEGGRGR